MASGGIDGEQNNGLDEPVDKHVTEIDSSAEKFSPVAKTLSGDLRDFLLDWLRTLPKPWAQLSEREQRIYAHAIDDFCRILVSRAVKLIGADERVAIEVLLEQVAFKPKGIEAKLGIHASDKDIRHALVDAQNKEILIVVADAAAYLGERAPVRIDRQQPDLPLDPGAEQRVEAELDTIIASGEMNPAAQRESSEQDPFIAGRAAALRGLGRSHNPFDLGSANSALWTRGHADGAAERSPTVSAALGKQRADGADQTSQR